MTHSPCGLGLAGRALALGLLLLLGGCSGTGLVPGGTTEMVGEGAHLVGVQVTTEPDNLAGGAANADHLAARMAVARLTRTDVRVQILDYAGDRQNLITATNDLLDGRVGMIVGPRGGGDAEQVARMLEGFTTLVGTGFEKLSGQRVFAAGVSPGQEALAIAAELKRRHARQVALVGTAQANSAAFVRLLQQALVQQGISSFERVGGSPATLADGLRAPDGSALDAIVFATPPETAGHVLAAFAEAGTPGKPAIFGPTDWALAPPDKTPTDCLIPIPRGSDLAGFANRFRDSNDLDPTLSAAVVYDLVVLAGALPQVADANPYDAAIIGNAQGFSGVTGSFVFGADGRAERRFTISACP